MDTIRNILLNSDKEQRYYLWLHFLRKLELSLKNMELSPAYKRVKAMQEEIIVCLEQASALKTGKMHLDRFDWEKQKAVYRSAIAQEEVEEWIEDLASFLPTSRRMHTNFTELKEFVYSATSIEPIGLEQLYSAEGYAFVKYKEEHHTRIYQYHISKLSNAAQRVSVYLNPLSQFTYSISYGFEQAKKELNRKSKARMLNTYLIECNLPVPYESTLLPVVKGKLAKFLSEN